MRTLALLLVALNCCLGQTPPVTLTPECEKVDAANADYPPGTSGLVGCYPASQTPPSVTFSKHGSSGMYRDQQGKAHCAKNGREVRCRSSQVLRDRCRREIKECSPPNYCDHLPACEGMLTTIPSDGWYFKAMPLPKVPPTPTPEVH